MKEIRVEVNKVLREIHDMLENYTSPPLKTVDIALEDAAKLRVRLLCVVQLIFSLDSDQAFVPANSKCYADFGEMSHGQVIKRIAAFGGRN